MDSITDYWPRSIWFFFPVTPETFQSPSTNAFSPLCFRWVPVSFELRNFVLFLFDPAPATLMKFNLVSRETFSTSETIEVKWLLAENAAHAAVRQLTSCGQRVDNLAPPEQGRKRNLLVFIMSDAARCSPDSLFSVIIARVGKSLSATPSATMLFKPRWEIRFFFNSCSLTWIFLVRHVNLISERVNAGTSLNYVAHTIIYKRSFQRINIKLTASRRNGSSLFSATATCINGYVGLAANQSVNFPARCHCLPLNAFFLIKATFFLCGSFVYVRDITLNRRRVIIALGPLACCVWKRTWWADLKVVFVDGLDFRRTVAIFNQNEKRIAWIFSFLA